MRPGPALAVAGGLLLATCATALGSPEDPGTVGELRQRCLAADRLYYGTGPGDPLGAGYCLGYMRAAMAARGLCVDSPMAAVHTFLIWAELNPGTWEEHEATAIALLSVKYPCKAAQE
jgi:hypothetical protein